METVIVNDNDNLYYDAKDLGVRHHVTEVHETVTHTIHPAANDAGAKAPHKD